MRFALLTRTETSDEGTFGTLEIAGHSFATGELPDRGNQPEVSCIPAGTYVCTWNFSNRFKREMYQVLDVPDRTGVRIHSANFMGDKSLGYRAELNGCIALGRSIGTLNNQRAVITSRAAVEDFENLMGGEDFELQIVDSIADPGGNSAL